MSKEKFKISKDGTGLKIKAFGKDKKQVFESLMLGMQESLRPKITNRRVETKIEIKSEDLESLLFEFLSEINYLNEVNCETYQKIMFNRISDTELEAELFGKKAARFGAQIKDISPRDLSICERTDGDWEATALLMI